MDRAVGVSLSEVGRTGQRVDVVHGGDVAPDGRLLSVAEIQQAFRELRARAVGCEARTVVLPRPGAGTGPTAGGGPNLVLPPAAGGGDATSVIPSVGGDGGERVDPVPMPETILAWIRPFVAEHYKPEPRKKMKRNDPFADDASVGTPARDRPPRG